MPKKILAVVSGGMDSTAMAYGFKRTDELAAIVSFDYGQRHKKELDYACATANSLGVPWYLLNVEKYGRSVTSALTSPEITVPEGHYTEESMKITVVPNRNMVMLSMAAGIAISNHHDGIATAVHAGDHAIYPDCRPLFIESLQSTLLIANEGFIKPDFKVVTPFINSTKGDIARLGTDWFVPWEETWSCYEGGVIHCGRCATCIERMEAFIIARVGDPTEYATWDSYNELAKQGIVAD